MFYLNYIKRILFIFTLCSLFTLETFSSNKVSQDNCVQALKASSLSDDQLIQKLLVEESQNQGILDKLKELIGQGYDVNKPFEDGTFPLEQLLKSKSDQNNFPLPVIFDKLGFLVNIHLRKLQILLKAGADPNQIFSTGQTPLEYVVTTFQPYLSLESDMRKARGKLLSNVTFPKGWRPYLLRELNMLFGARADPNKSFSNNMLPVEQLLKSKMDYKNKLKALKLFLEVGADPKLAFSTGETHLEYVIGLEYDSQIEEKSNEDMEIEMLETLIRAGANVNEPFSTGITPLEHIIRYKKDGSEIDYQTERHHIRF